MAKSNSVIEEANIIHKTLQFFSFCNLLRNRADSPMQPPAEGVKARHSDLRWDPDLLGGSVITKLSEGHAQLI